MNTRGVCETREKLNRKLFEAIQEGDEQKVKELIEKGADVNARDKNNYTPLLRAVSRGNLKIVKILVEYGADINAKEKFFGYTPIHIAAMKGYTDVLIFLLKKGADPNVRDKYGIHHCILQPLRGMKMW
ncbi:MAG: ankyrin repeat domain-containing protein [Persephonella sp.]|nr:ankyrin repeat domain-containing protein [Persephonella sp.]